MENQRHVKEIYTYPDGTTLLYYQQNLNKCTDVSVGFRIPRVSAPDNGEIIGVYNKNLVFYQTFDDRIKIPVIKPGLPHFVEHMIFSSLPDMEKQKIYDFFTKTNTCYNAYTSSDSLVAEFNCPSKFNKEVFQLFAKMIFRNTYNEADLENEKKPVYQELQMYLNPPKFSVINILYSNSNLLNSVDILGIDKKIIDSFDEKQMIRFVKTYFTRENMIISVVSDKSFEEIKTLCENCFVNIAPSIKETRVKTPMIAFSFEDNIICHKDRNSKTAEISLILRSNSDDETNSVYSVVEDFILNEFTGRLLTKLRNNDGLVYKSNFSELPLFGSGAFKIFSATTTKKNVKIVTDTMISILYDMARNGITNEEFEGFKEMWENRRDRISNIKYVGANEMFQKFLYDEKPFTGEFNKKISEITKEDIDNYLKETYSNAKFCFSVSGNFNEKDLPTKGDIAKFRPLDEYMQTKFLDNKARDNFVEYINYIHEHPEDCKKIKFVKDETFKEYVKLQMILNSQLENSSEEQEEVEEDAEVKQDQTEEKQDNEQNEDNELELQKK